MLQEPRTRAHDVGWTYPIAQPSAAKTDVGGEAVVAKKRQQEREYL